MEFLNGVYGEITPLKKDSLILALFEELAGNTIMYRELYIYDREKVIYPILTFPSRRKGKSTVFMRTHNTSTNATQVARIHPSIFREGKRMG